MYLLLKTLVSGYTIAVSCWNTVRNHKYGYAISRDNPFHHRNKINLTVFDPESPRRTVADQTVVLTTEPRSE